MKFNELAAIICFSLYFIYTVHIEDATRNNCVVSTVCAMATLNFSLLTLRQQPELTGNVNRRKPITFHPHKRQLILSLATNSPQPVEQKPIIELEFIGVATYIHTHIYYFKQLCWSCMYLICVFVCMCVYIIYEWIAKSGRRW